MFVLLKSSIGKKILMAVSSIFLMFFLLQHFIINFISVIDSNTFNILSHFMGTNPFVQFILQPVLLTGVLFHFTLGFYLEYKNNQATKYNYNKFLPNSNSTWMSRNMIFSGIVILSFLLLHFYDFWVPEINYKYIQSLPENPNRYYEELIHKFENPIRVFLYCFSFLLLSLHLSHGFSSALKSLGTKSNYINSMKSIKFLFIIIIPFGFCFIAIFHHINNL